MKTLKYIILFVLIAAPMVSLVSQVPADSVATEPEIPDLTKTTLATGTGRTTGHIANLLVSNKTKTDIDMLAQDVYIPSSGGYQSYVAKIQRTTISAGTTVTIPVSGFCADVHSPPVPSGISMPPLNLWIALKKESVVEAGTAFDNVVDTTAAPFTPSDIPQLITSPGYKAEPVSTTPGNFPVWPGTDVLVGGMIDPAKDPLAFGPVIIEALLNITKAYAQQKKENKISTPFGNDPVKEREAVIQQTFWIYMADITGEKYEKEHFRDKTVKQFEENSGKLLAALPADQKKEMEGGIDQFWNVFTAVGTEAKVLSLRKE